MDELLKRLCEIDGASGNEAAVRSFIISEIEGYCEYSVDPLGNIIAFKKGKNASAEKLLIDAHMDEVGLIITSVTADGFLRFKRLGGIDPAVMMSRRVRINGKINGVIGSKPVHLLKGDEAKKLPDSDSLYIDIGACDKEDALKYIQPGDYAVMCGEYSHIGDNIISKAIDDRAGCAVLIRLLREESSFDFYASFSVEEELGTRGAKTAAYTVNPQSAIILEATTAADIAGVPDGERVCTLGKGAAVSFMDNATVYDREYYKAAISGGITCQPKSAVAGGNNAGAVHLSRGGVRTVALSVPCRYLHSASCVACYDDIESVYNLTKYMIKVICGEKAND